MSEATHSLVRDWLAKAAEDLEAAHRLAAEPKPLWASALYHCQQAGEKAVKGFLAFDGVPFADTHDIEVLVGEAANVDTDFSSWVREAAVLTPLATTYRYPPNPFPPTREEYDQAIDAATRLYDFVLSRLPATTHPSAA